MRAIPTAGELAALKPATTILTSFSALTQNISRPTVIRLIGSVDVPETAIYQFSIKEERGRQTRIVVYDATRRFVESSQMSWPPTPVMLARGRHPIEIIAYQLSGSLEMELDWRIADRKPMPVPAEAFWHNPLGKPR